MSYGIEIVRKGDQKTSKWSGGTTTELFIYPKDAIYSERNFEWRLSSAIVDIEESVFTSLPGIERIIMIIEGELLLKHEGHHTAKLKKYEQDSFSGNWTTRSFGKVRDFNLMMKKGSSGSLEAIFINENESIDVKLKKELEVSKKFSSKAQAFYIVKGNIEVNFSDDKKETLSQGDLLLISGSLEEDFPLMRVRNGNEKAEIIKADICV